MRTRPGSRARRFVAATAAAVLAVAVLAAACGGGGGKKVDAEDWVDDVCDLAIDYKERSDARGEDFASIDFSKAKSAKEDIVELLKEQRDDLDDAVADFKKLGQPDIEGGSDVQKAFVKDLDESGSELDKVIKAVEKLDTGRGFDDDVFEIFGDVEDTDLRGELEDLADEQDEVQDIIDLIDDNPECAEALFEDSDTASDPEPAPTARRTGTPAARSTPKPNASKNEKWVQGFCMAIQDFVDGVEIAAEKMSPPGNPTNEQVKSTLVAFLQEAHKVALAFKKDVEALGSPDIKDGKQVQAALAKTANEVAVLFEQAVKDAQALDTRDATRMENSINGLVQRLETGSEKIGRAFDDIDASYDTADFDEIAQGLPECAGII